MGAIVVAAVPAYAFQEQKIGGAPVTPAAPIEQPATSPATPDLQLSPAEVAKPSEGTEVRIPGLGRLGVLPKMDFGLELLYGADGTKSPVDDPAAEAPSDDLQIRGTVKHNF